MHVQLNGDKNSYTLTKGQQLRVRDHASGHLDAQKLNHRDFERLHLPLLSQRDRHEVWLLLHPPSNV